MRADGSRPGGAPRARLELTAGLIVVLGIALTLGADGAAAQGAAKPFAHAIKPRGIAEECFRLSAGASIGFAFQSAAPVDFNVHFHRGNDIEYPVKRDQVRQADERFTAPLTGEYCLMWTYRTLERVTVQGEMKP